MARGCCSRPVPGLLALDTETLETVWQSEAPATEVVQAPAQQIQQGVVLGPGGMGDTER